MNLHYLPKEDVPVSLLMPKRAFSQKITKVTANQESTTGKLTVSPDGFTGKTRPHVIIKRTLPQGKKRLVAGITGTRTGTTLAQYRVLAMFLLSSDWTSLHHGCCIGVDQDAHYLAKRHNIPIVIHPPTNRVLMKDELLLDAHIIMSPKPYLKRDLEIVQACDHLFVIPSGFNETLRSGTWATARYGRKMGKPITIIYPDGDILDIEGSK